MAKGAGKGIWRVNGDEGKHTGELHCPTLGPGTQEERKIREEIMLSSVWEIHETMPGREIRRHEEYMNMNNM